MAMVRLAPRSTSGGIAPLSLTISDPPTQGEVAAIVALLNPFLEALQRT